MAVLGRISSYRQSECRCSPVDAVACHNRNPCEESSLTQTKQIQTLHCSPFDPDLQLFRTLQKRAGSHPERCSSPEPCTCLLILHTVPFPPFFPSFSSTASPANVSICTKSPQNLRGLRVEHLSKWHGHVPAVSFFPVATYAKPASSETLRAGARESFLSRGLLSFRPFMIRCMRVVYHCL